VVSRRGQRIGLLVAALVVAVIAFVVVQSGGDDNSSSGVTHISVKGGVLDGDPQTIEVKKGDTVQIVVSSDAPDEIHLHGYDIEKEAAPGKPARFKFKANVEGAFIIESHAAEDAGKEPLLARLHVGPS
jgi:plastocyanin